MHCSRTFQGAASPSANVSVIHPGCCSVADDGDGPRASPLAFRLLAIGMRGRMTMARAAGACRIIPVK